MVVSRKIKTILYDEPLPKMPKFEPSHWRSTSEYLDEEVHNDYIHGVVNGNKQSTTPEGTTTGT